MDIPKRKLLVVDDIELNRMMLSDLFEEHFDVLEAENGRDALELIYIHEDDLSVILLDLIMPVMNGFEVLEELRKSKLMEHVPVILITGENDDDKILTGYNMGVSDIINKPFNPQIVDRRVNNVIDLYSHKKDMERRLQEQKTMLEAQAARLRQSNQFVIDALSTTVEFRSMESGEHIKRIRVLTREILQALRVDYPLTDEEIETISNASVVHDIGKIAISDTILLKPGPLTKEEFEIMKTHTVKGCEILGTLYNMEDGNYYYTYCYEICRHHHERWDGRGYPDGLKGDEISIWAQATSLADVYDALTSKRVYKAAFSHEKAVEMIVNGECGAFNPKMLQCFNDIKDILFDKIHTPTRLDLADLTYK